MNTKTKNNHGAVHVGFVMIGGIVVMHIVMGVVIWVFSIKPGIKIGHGQTLPAAATITPRPTQVIATPVQAEPQIVAASRRNILLNISNGPGYITLYIPGMCAVDYSRDLETWNYLGTYLEPTEETFTCTEEQLYFRARATRP